MEARVVQLTAPPLAGSSLKIRLAETVDHLPDGRALRAGGEIQRHAVPQDRMGQRHHVIDRRRETSFDQSAGANGQHERLARARRWSPRYEVADGVAGPF